MPFKCCVLGCRGNYLGGPKVSVFAFPKDPPLLKKWLQAISRQDFTPSNNSKVCELHFNNEDIVRVTEMHLPETGEVIRVPFKTPRLIKGMPDTCCVPNCRSNYQSQSETFSVFSFPRDSERRLKWVRAIKRENFTPTKRSRVCELHFRKKDILRSTKFYSATGDEYDVALLIPRLKPDAVPSQLPRCSDYVAKPEKSSQEGPEPKKARLEHATFADESEGSNARTSDLLEEEMLQPLKAPRLPKDKVRSELPGCPEESLKRQGPGHGAVTEVIRDNDALTSFDDFNNKLDTLELKGWLVSRQSELINFFLDSDSRVIKLCVSVNKHLKVTVFYEGHRLKVGQTKINSLRQLRNCLRNAPSILGASDPSSASAKIGLIKDLLCSLRDEIPEHTAVIDSVIEKVFFLEVNCL